jgi:predicted homoserine dehydrogenase-like protein
VSAGRAPRPIRVGVVGTGFVASRFTRAFHGRQGITVSHVLTRRRLGEIRGFPLPDALTGSPERLVDGCDVVLECSGDVLHAMDVVAAALAAGRPVVTMNAELHVTCGSYLVGRGLLSEAEGDQPGALAALHEEALGMGFRPLVLGNLKGFLNPDPSPGEMRHWAGAQGISLPMVTAATDGTKIQVEQALIANHVGARIVREGLHGLAHDDWRAGAFALADAAATAGGAVSDYVLSRQAPHGVFIVAEHDPEEAANLAYFKLGPGPRYLLLRPNIFVHLEIPRTIRRLLERGEVTLDNSASPRLGVAALAKRPIAAGTSIDMGIGSFDLRGSCVRIAERPEHVPIGLVRHAVVTRALAPGQMLEWSDIELPDSLALRAWREIRAQVLAASGRGEPP